MISYVFVTARKPENYDFIGLTTHAIVSWVLPRLKTREDKFTGTVDASDGPSNQKSFLCAAKKQECGSLVLTPEPAYHWLVNKDPKHHRNIQDEYIRPEQLTFR
jgi:hypothetical protein